MNENLNLVEILKDCPKGTKLYSSVFGEVELDHIDTSANYPIIIRLKGGEGHESITSEGKMFADYDGECVLFPSREERDWSKFKPKKNKFDPKTLNAFDKVLVRLTKDCIWNATFFSHYDKEINWGCHPCVTTSCKSYDKCIPYNDETKHLLGTSEEAPEYYRYWED